MMMVARCFIAHHHDLYCRGLILTDRSPPPTTGVVAASITMTPVDGTNHVPSAEKARSLTQHSPTSIERRAHHGSMNMEIFPYKAVDHMTIMASALGDDKLLAHQSPRTKRGQ